MKTILLLTLASVTMLAACEVPDELQGTQGCTNRSTAGNALMVARPGLPVRCGPQEEPIG